MEPTKTTVRIGLEKPLRVLHISDNHLSYADERDDERKRALAASRQISFGCKGDKDYETLIAQIDYANEHCDLLVHTGDVIDFVSHLNLEKAHEAFSRAKNLFMAVGNHEFSRYVGEAWEDAEYRSKSLALVQSAFKNDIRFASRVVNGVNLIAIDNGYYLIEQAQLDALKAECAKGMPVILLMHVPLHADDLCEDMMNVRGEPCSYLMNTPDSIVDTYSDHRARQQRADSVTREAYGYIVSEPMIKAIIAGHVHGRCYESKVTDTLTQYIVDVRTARRITII